MEGGVQPSQELTTYETEFLADRDSFYMSTVGETGWPYLQHRGGPKGFLQVMDSHTLAFADFRGNRQYISTGNLSINDRVALILVDYPNQARLKILGHTEVLEGDALKGDLARPLIEKLRAAGEKSVVERVFLIHIAAFDWNCPQHITQRYTAEEIQSAMEPLNQRMEQLEKENQELKAKLAKVA
jgi:hypothetical protein